eukprot:TRINITY_DN7049_c0_g1_i8.p2 TRINITY_DN7049_c0_g1~~TRINITY_DN7049_c0_g1_i8.p2  ORF type:complete len:140 (-),score=26.70 TRINITY_DN7049_c0_g1_i8:58-477(-)
MHIVCPAAECAAQIAWPELELALQHAQASQEGSAACLYLVRETNSEVTLKALQSAHEEIVCPAAECAAQIAWPELELALQHARASQEGSAGVAQAAAWEGAQPSMAGIAVSGAAGRAWFAQASASCCVLPLPFSSLLWR